MEESRSDVLVVTALKDEFDALLDLELDGEGRSAWTEQRDRHGFPFHVRAGRRGEVFLGDVLVADRVYAYDSGKHVAASEGREEQFLHDFKTYNLKGSWGMDAAFFGEEFARSWEGMKERPPSKASQRRWLLHALYAHEHEEGPAPVDHPERKTRCPAWAELIQELREDGLLGKTHGQLQLTKKGERRVEDERLLDPENEKAGDPAFRVHVGPIATGKAVQEDPKLFERLKRSGRKVLGVEMEAAAIGFVAERGERRSLIVKAVSDHGDLDNDDAYRRFACRASAAFLVAFLRKYLRPEETADGKARKAGSPRLREREGKHPRENRREEFLAQVESACGLREPQGARIMRRPGPPPFDEFLEVTVQEGRFQRVSPVAALDQRPTEEVLEDFLQKVHEGYHQKTPGVFSTLVHVGTAAPEKLIQKAYQRQVKLMSFAEYQGLIDFSAYLQRQTERLERDPLYPPGLYVPQRARVLIGAQGGSEVEDVLDTLRGMLSSPGPCFALVLGDFGTGKTFLLHELARRMASEGSALLPVLIEMRSLQKGRRMRELVAQHFASEDMMGRFEVDPFLYMLRQGRIALLFDGFDELALRVTYEQVLKHFDTLLEAAEGEAKVIVTSRTQNFLTDQDVKQELARRAESLRGYRLLKLQRFSVEQVRRFLVKRLGSEDVAEEYLHLLRDVRDLLELSENPRLLSFIVDLGVEKLRAAREGRGEITSAKLYELLIDQWIDFEHERVNPEGAPKGLTREQLRGAANELARLLWVRTERTVGLDELPGELFAAVNAEGQHLLDVEVIRYQLGSGSLLVRDAEGRFSFIHQSVLEWLVAESAAEEVRTSGDSNALGRSEMSELMVDFFIRLAGEEVARAWVIARLYSPANEVAKRNALRVQGRLPTPSGETQSPEVLENLEGLDLRGQDLSGKNLRRANLSRAKLSGMTLVEADLTEARLSGSDLGRADLERAKLGGAELTGARLSGARLLGADLRGAVLRGAKLRAAKLVGARVDSLGDCDVFGAAMPAPTRIEAIVEQFSLIECLAISPTDDLLATGHRDGTIGLWDWGTGKALRVLEGHSSAVMRVAFSSDGATLASSSRDDQTVRLWNVAEGRTQQVLEELGDKLCMAFSQDGATLAFGSSSKGVRLWSVAEGRVLRVLGGSRSSVSDLAISPDGATLATLSRDTKKVRLWSVAEGRQLRVLEGPSTFYRLVFSPDGATLASCSWQDHVVRLWSVAEGRELRVLEGHSNTVMELAFSPDGAMLASGSSDRTVRLWSVAEGRTRRVLSVLEDHSGSIAGLAFSPDGATLASASTGSGVWLWSVAEGRRLRVLEGHGGFAQGVVFSPDGATLASEWSDGKVRLWSAAEGRTLRTLWMPGGHGVYAINSMAISPDGATLATGSNDKTVKLWSVTARRKPRLLRGHLEEVTSVAFSPDGAMLASGSLDRSVRLWSVVEGRELRRLVHPRSFSVYSVAFSPDGGTVAAAGSSGVMLWSMAERRRPQVLEGHSKLVHSVAFSPDGGTLASGSEDGTVRLWRVAEGWTPRVMETHSGVVRSVAFSPDSALLIADSEDGLLHCWDVATGALLASYLGSSDGWVAFRPDGRYKLEGNLDGAFWHTIGLCRFEPGELDPYLPTPLRIPDDEPFLPSRR